MGGGRRSFAANWSAKEGYVKEVVDKNVCARTDGRNLVKEWIEDKAAKQLSYQYLSDESDINLLDTERTEYVLGEHTTCLRSTG